jgi:hypothetical protein
VPSCTFRLSGTADTTGVPGTADGECCIAFITYQWLLPYPLPCMSPLLLLTGMGKAELLPSSAIAARKEAQLSHFYQTNHTADRLK